MFYFNFIELSEKVNKVNFVYVQLKRFNAAFSVLNAFFISLSFFLFNLVFISLN